MGGIDGGWRVAATALALLATAGSALAARVERSSPPSRQRAEEKVEAATGASDGPRAKPGPVPVKVLGDPAGFFGAAAYPPDAIRANEQGRSVVRVAVDPGGMATGCSVVSSSGSSALDEATCRIATTRMRFSAARDERGRPMAGRYTLPVRWVLPVTTLPTAVNTSMEAEITVGTDGAVEACTGGGGRAAGVGGPCAMWPVGRRIIAPPTRDGRPVKAHIVIAMDIATSFDP